LKCIYDGCHGLLYGKEDQTLFIHDEFNKVIQNSKWSGLFLESFRREILLKNKVVGPYIFFVATFGWITIGQNDSSSL